MCLVCRKALNHQEFGETKHFYIFSLDFWSWEDQADQARGLAGCLVLHAKNAWIADAIWECQMQYYSCHEEGASAVSKPCSVTQWYTNSCQFSEGLFINRNKKHQYSSPRSSPKFNPSNLVFLLSVAGPKHSPFRPKHKFRFATFQVHLGREEPMGWNPWNQPDAIFTSLALYELPVFFVERSQARSEKKSCTVKYLWNRPAIYVAANQFHHKHEDMFVCDMFDVVDMDIEFARVSQEAFPVCASIQGKCHLNPQRGPATFSPKSTRRNLVLDTPANCYAVWSNSFEVKKWDLCC